MPYFNEHFEDHSALLLTVWGSYIKYHCAIFACKHSGKPNEVFSLLVK